MSPDRTEPHFIEDERGGLTTSYGPFMLKSAFQPIFSQTATGQLTIEAFEALIRPFRVEKPVPPGQFFDTVEDRDALFVDRLCRELHLRNMIRLNRNSARLFVNLNPALYGGSVDFDREVNRLLTLSGRMGLQPSRIICEITEQGSDERRLVEMVEKLRRAQFRIAVDDYGAEESDLERVDRLRPDIVKFDADWIHRHSETPAGRLVLEQIVSRFKTRRISCLFEGLEEEADVTFCARIGVQLLQGFALARPEIVPTTFNARFPETPSDTAERESPGDLVPRTDSVRRVVETPVESTTPPRAQDEPRRGRGSRTIPFGRRGR